MTEYERIRYEMIWAPLVHGLTVIEPKTELDRNLAWFDFKRAVAGMDDMAEWANRKKDQS